MRRKPQASALSGNGATAVTSWYGTNEHASPPPPRTTYRTRKNLSTAMPTPGAGAVTSFSARIAQAEAQARSETEAQRKMPFCRAAPHHPPGHQQQDSKAAAAAVAMVNANYNRVGGSRRQHQTMARREHQAMVQRQAAAAIVEAQQRTVETRLQDAYQQQELAAIAAAEAARTAAEARWQAHVAAIAETQRRAAAAASQSAAQENVDNACQPQRRVPTAEDAPTIDRIASVMLQTFTTDNADGSVTLGRSQFFRVAKRIVAIEGNLNEVTAQQCAELGAMHRLFEDLDVDGDGIVSPTELRNALVKAAQGNFPELKKMVEALGAQPIGPRAPPSRLTASQTRSTPQTHLAPRRRCAASAISGRMNSLGRDAPHHPACGELFMKSNSVRSAEQTGDLAANLAANGLPKRRDGVATFRPMAIFDLSTNGCGSTLYPKPPHVPISSETRTRAENAVRQAASMQAALTRAQREIEELRTSLDNACRSACWPPATRVEACVGDAPRVHTSARNAPTWLKAEASGTLDELPAAGIAVPTLVSAACSNRVSRPCPYHRSRDHAHTRDTNCTIGSCHRRSHGVRSAQ